MPIVNNHPSIVEVVTGAVGSNSDSEGPSFKSGARLDTLSPLIQTNSDSEVVTASGDLDFDSILEVEGFLDNSVFAEDEETSCGSSSTFGSG